MEVQGGEGSGRSGWFVGNATWWRCALQRLLAGAEARFQGLEERGSSGEGLGWRGGRKMGCGGWEPLGRRPWRREGQSSRQRTADFPREEGALGRRLRLSPRHRGKSGGRSRGGSRRALLLSSLQDPPRSRHHCLLRKGTRQRGGGPEAALGTRARWEAGTAAQPRGRAPRKTRAPAASSPAPQPPPRALHLRPSPPSPSPRAWKPLSAFQSQSNCRFESAISCSVCLGFSLFF